MDDFRFDTLARALARPSRRMMLRRLAGFALGGMLIPALDDAAAHDLTATCKKLKGDKKKKCLKKARKHTASHAVAPSPTPTRSGTTARKRAAGSACGVDSDCQSNVCGGGVCCSGACALTNATPNCEPETGRCFLTCNAGWGNCEADGIPADGCETSLIDNPQHCGDCGNDCAVGCNSGVGTCQGDTCSCL